MLENLLYVEYNGVARLRKGVKKGKKMKRHWLIQKRKGKGMSQKELAKLCGVSNKTISKIELGYRMPSGELAYKLSKVLGFDMTLFYREKDCA